MTSVLDSLPITPQGYARRICLSDPLRAWTHSSFRALHLSSCVTPLLITATWWHWNLNQLSIPYAFWPRVRSRLTLGGRAFPRKPQVYGGQDSHLPSRLLMPAFSLPNSPPLLTVWLLPVRNAPLPMFETFRGFGTMLSPVEFSAQDHLTSELLRTL